MVIYTYVLILFWFTNSVTMAIVCLCNVIIWLVRAIVCDVEYYIVVDNVIGNIVYCAAMVFDFSVFNEKLLLRFAPSIN